ncbi:MAG: flavodoxin family protein [Anaerolineae bacterium]|nr:flavodoxin family protein [Anaerolineae bacterium]
MEIIHLIDYRIEHCRGCEVCGHTGQCAIRDDHQSICQKLERAQGVIICSPVFGGFYSAILKTFYDRLTCTLGFSGRFNHLCTVAITTAKYDFRVKTAKDMATLSSSWRGSGHITGYIHKSVLDTGKSRIVTLTPQNSPRLYASALKMGAKLVDDIRQGRRDDLPLPVRLLFKYLVLPGIAKILINHRDQAEFLYQTMKRQGIITDRLLQKHARHMAKIAADGECKTLEKIIMRK